MLDQFDPPLPHTKRNLDIVMPKNIISSQLHATPKPVQNEVLHVNKLEKDYGYNKQVADILERDRHVILQKTKKERSKRRKEKQERDRAEVNEFLKDPRFSYELPDKKHQMKSGEGRFALTDTFYNLHAVFVTEKESSMKFTTFCKHVNTKKFIKCDFTRRHVCLCAQHCNMGFICTACKGILPSTSSELLKMTNNQILTSVEDRLEQELIIYEQWNNRDPITKEKARFKIYKVVESKDLFLVKLRERLPKFRRHVMIKNNQIAEVKRLQATLTRGEMIAETDYSENYPLVYMNEAQSAFFHRAQCTICPFHMTSLNEDSSVCKQMFVGVSDEKSHSLATTLAFIKTLIPVVRHADLKTIHFVSDSPGSQYRNRFVAHMVHNFPVLFKGLNATWTWYEVGHGKGPCDGAGGAVKRKADNIIKRPNVLIENAEDFVSTVSKETEMTLFKVTPEQVAKERKVIVSWKATGVKDIMLAHAIVNRSTNGRLYKNEKSCFDSCCRSISRTGEATFPLQHEGWTIAVPKPTVPAVTLAAEAPTKDDIQETHDPAITPAAEAPTKDDIQDDELYNSDYEDEEY